MTSRLSAAASPAAASPGSSASKRRRFAWSSSRRASIRCAKPRSRWANRASKSARTTSSGAWTSSRICASASSRNSGCATSLRRATTATSHGESNSVPAVFPPVPSFQLDRGRFENMLLDVVVQVRHQRARRMPRGEGYAGAGRAYGVGDDAGGRRHDSRSLGRRRERPTGADQAPARTRSAEHAPRQRLLVSRCGRACAWTTGRTIPRGARACRPASAGSAPIT